MSVTTEPILPRVPASWSTSQAQRDRLEELAARYPATHFQAVMYWSRSCALQIEWWDTNSSGEFILSPNGRTREVR